MKRPNPIVRCWRYMGTHRPPWWLELGVPILALIAALLSLWIALTNAEMS